MLSELLTGHPGQGIADGDSRRRHGQLFRRHPHHRAGRHRPLARRATITSPSCPQSLLAANVGATRPSSTPICRSTIQVHRWLPNSRAARGRSSEEIESGHGRLRPAASRRRSAAGDRRRRGRRAASIFPPPTSSCFPRRPANRSARILSTPGLIEQPRRSRRPARTTLRCGSSGSIIRSRSRSKTFRFDRYTGTNTAKNYSSLVELKDPRRNVDREVLIWMNNPLRYAGTTFYQADFDRGDGEDGTVLQVVKNPSWMTPYVACMLVATGMLAHFGVMLVRFLRRRAEEATSAGSGIAHQATVAGQDRDHQLRQCPLVRAGRRSPSGSPPIVARDLRRLRRQQSADARIGAQRDADLRIRQAAARLPGPHQAVRHAGPQHAADSFRPAGSRACEQRRQSRRQVAGHPLAARRDLRMPKRPATTASSASRTSTCSTRSASSTAPLFWRYSLERNSQARTASCERQIELAEATPEKERSLFQNKVLELRDEATIFTLSLVLSFRSPPLSDEPAINLMASLRASAADDRAAARRPARRTPCRPTTPPADWTPLMEAEFQMLLRSGH